VRIIEGGAMEDFSLLNDGNNTYMIVGDSHNTGPIIDGVVTYKNDPPIAKQCVVVVKLDSLNRYVSHFVTDTSLNMTLNSGSLKDALCFSGTKWSDDDIINPEGVYTVDSHMAGKEIYSTKDYVLMSGSFIKNGRMYITGTFRWEEGINVIEGDSLLPMHHYIQGYGEWQADHTIFTVIKDIEQDSFILKSTSGGSGDNKIYDVEMNEKGELMVCGKCIADTFMVNNETIDAPRKSGLSKKGFVYKLDADGNKIFAKILYSNTGDYIYRLDYDEEGNTYIGVQSYGRTSMFDDVVLSSDNSIGGEQANILKLDKDGNVKWKVQAVGDEYTFPRTMEAGEELVYVAIQFSYDNEHTTVMIGDISFPIDDDPTTYVVGFDKETGEYKNSFRFKEALVDNLLYIGRDTLMMYVSGPLNKIIEGGTSSYRSVIFHRIGGLTGLKEIAEENKRGLIYPNPVSPGGELTVVAPEGLNIEDMSIYNLKGELLHCEETVGNDGILNIGFLPPGMYLVKIGTKEYDYMEKVVVGD